MDTAQKLAAELRETAEWLRERAAELELIPLPRKRSAEARDVTVTKLRGRAVLLETVAGESPETRLASPLHPHTAALLQILDATEGHDARCWADTRALVGRVRHLAAGALGEALPEELCRDPPAAGG